MTHLPDDKPRNNPETAQEHSGTGDNVGGDKVDQRDATVYGNAPKSQGSNIVSGQSVSGNVIKIINYYYHEDTQIKTDEKADEDSPCPYRGLYHFSPQDAEFFFGRDVFVEELDKAVQSRNFVAVLGASGSGKSSVVFAGLVPRLVKETHWLFTHFRPGSDPFFALAMALVPLYETNLSGSDLVVEQRKLATRLKNNEQTISDTLTQIQQQHHYQKILIIGDQFEELYTLCKEIETRDKFLDCLIECLSFSQSNSSSKITTVITMRADFLGSALGYRPFADHINENNIMLGEMDEKEIRDIIVEPAEKKGVTFQDGLVERIFDSVEKESGSLPLLEFALTLLWEKREGKLLTHKAYEEIGELEGALANYADDRFKDLSDTEKEATRKIFIQLVRPGEGTEDTRRVSVKDEIGEANWELVNKLADSRLVVTSKEENQQETVEVVHETLIRNWAQLRQWMEKDRNFRAWQERLRSLIKQWENTGEDPGALLRGVSLGEAEEWFGKRGDELSDSEKTYIQESIKIRDELMRQKNERKQRELNLEKQAKLEALKAQQEAEKREKEQKENNRKLRNRAWLLGGLSIVAIGIASFAVLSWRDSRGRAVKASLRDMASQSQLLLAVNPLEGLLLAIQAVGKNEQKLKGKRLYEVNLSLLKATEESRERLQLRGHEGNVSSVGYSPDGKTVVSGSRWDKTVKVWDAQSGNLVQTLRARGHEGEIKSVGYSPDGKTILSGSTDNTVKVWDAQSGNLVQTLRGHEGEVWSVGYSPDGKTIVTGSDDSTVRVWESQSGQLVQTLTGHEGKVSSVAYSPDGKTIVTGSWDKTVKVWDAQSGNLVQTFRGHEGKVSSVAYSPDGKSILSGSTDNTVRVWDPQSGNLVQTLIGHQEDVTSVGYSPDGKTIVTGSTDNTVKVWDSQSGNLIQTLRGHQEDVTSVGYSPDGKTIVSGSEDSTARVWDAQSGNLVQTLRGHEGDVSSVGYSPDGKTIVSGSRDKTVRVWDQQDFLYRACQRLERHPALSVDPIRDEKSQGEITEAKIAQEAAKTCFELGDWNNAQKAQFRVRQGFAYAEYQGNIKEAERRINQAKKLTPEIDKEKYQQEAKKIASIYFIEQGKKLSENGQLDKAITNFEKAKKLEPTINLKDLKQKTKKIASQYFVKEGKFLSKNGQLDKAITNFEKAKKLEPTINLEDLKQKAKKIASQYFVKEGEQLAQNDQINEAIENFKKARELAPGLIEAKSWIKLCWNGSLNKYAKDVMFACEKAVELAPDEGIYKGVRGVARSLTGDYQGAIEDLQAFMKNPNLAEEDKVTVKGWIKTLKNNENPFTDEVLEYSKNE